MKAINRLDILIWLPRIAFLVFAAICLGHYFNYLSAVVPFSYDWEPTDGDHLNFAHRLAQGLPIYLPLKDGQVLSIYNPLYHSVVAVIGGVDASMSLARFTSFLFWLFIPLSVLWYFRKRWGFFYAAVAALFICLPAEPWMLIDIVQVNQNSMMAFLFLATLLYATKCNEKQSACWWEWGALGVIAALCYLAKQQGLIALVVTLAFLLTQRAQWRSIAMTILGFFYVFIVSSIYLEFMNSGEYLRTTLFSLREIMITSPGLAKARLKEFLLYANFYFFICIIYSFYISLAKERKLNALSIWQISFLLHIPFLLAILGNGGGGPNYFWSIWISIVMVCIETIKKYQSSCTTPLTIAEPLVILVVIAIFGKVNHPNYAVMTCWVAVIIFMIVVRNNQEKYRVIICNALLIGLFVNSYVGMTAITRDLSGIELPGPALEKKMQDYYSSVSELVSGKDSLHILTHRNIGAFVLNNLNVENEGATMFSYAWNSPDVFNRKVIINAIRDQRFDLISTGLQEYPEDVKREIMANYRPVLTKEVNLYFGRMGNVTVFVPNTH